MVPGQVTTSHWMTSKPETQAPKCDYSPNAVTNLFEVASRLQKASRRADTAIAGYMAIEMFESNFARYCWMRLLTISAEDCAGIVTQELKALHDAWLVLTDDGRRHKSRILLSRAVLIRCQTRKCRNADYLQNFVYDRSMVDAQELPSAIEKARAVTGPIKWDHLGSKWSLFRIFRPSHGASRR